MYTRPYTDNDQPASTAHPPPLTPPSLVGSQSTPPRSRGNTSRPVHRPRASYTPTAHQHRHRCARFPPHDQELSTQPIPPTQARTTGVLRVTSAPAPSYECRHVSYTLQQLKARFSERDGGFASVALRRVGDQRPHHCLCCCCEGRDWGLPSLVRSSPHGEARVLSKWNTPVQVQVPHTHPGQHSDDVLVILE